MTPSDFGGLLLGLIVQNALFLGVTLWWARRTGRTWKSLGLSRPTWQHVWLGIGCGILLAGVAQGIGIGEIRLLRATVSPAAWQHLQQLTDTYGAEYLFSQLPAWWMMAVFAFIGSLLAPVCEEMLFRGLIFHAMQERLRLGTGEAIALSALLFALVHVSPLALLPLFLMGVAFSALYVRTGSLWVPITMHTVNNAINFAMLASFHQR